MMVGLQGETGSTSVNITSPLRMDLEASKPLPCPSMSSTETGGGRNGPCQAVGRAMIELWPCGVVAEADKEQGLELMRCNTEVLSPGWE